MAIDEYDEDEERTPVRDGVEELVISRVVSCPRHLAEQRKEFSDLKIPEVLVKVSEVCGGCKYFEYTTLDSKRLGCSYSSRIDFSEKQAQSSGMYQPKEVK